MTDILSADHIAAQEGGFEPQRQSNWLFEIALGGSDRDVLKLSMQSASLPPETNEVVALPYGNETRNVAGRITFDPIPLSIRDFVDQETRAALLRWRRQVCDTTTGAIGYAKDYKKDATITLYGPDGGMERRCHITGCWPSNMTPGTLDYNSSDPVLIEINLVYDKAVWDL